MPLFGGMTELQLLRKIAGDIKSMKEDLIEIKDLVYPSEDRIRPEFVDSVKCAENEPRIGESRVVKSGDIGKYLHGL